MLLASFSCARGLLELIVELTDVFRVLGRDQFNRAIVVPSPIVDASIRCVQLGQSGLDPDPLANGFEVWSERFESANEVDH